MPEKTFFFVAGASLLACTVTTLGISIISRFREWAGRNLIFFISFAAGVLVSISFLHLVPESMHMTPYAPGFLLAGFLGLFLINQILHVHADATGKERYAVGLIPMIGIGFHSFLDGIIYSVTFNVTVFTGSLAALGMVLHEFPEGIVTYVLLENSGFSRSKAFTYAFLAAAVTTPLGALISYPFVATIGKPFLGSLLALAAGALVYVGGTHLLPRTEESHSKKSMAALFLGISVGVAIILTKGNH
ncbi:MAG: ZIP family metal transporter [Desulfovibrionales bacterium]